MRPKSADPSVRLGPERLLWLFSDTWIGKVEIVGDIVNLDTTDLWDALRKD